MAEGGSDVTNSIKEGESLRRMGIGDFGTETDFDFRKILQRCWTFLLEHLNAEKTLDAFEQEGFLNPIKLRDIREGTTTTQKIRDIIGVVRKRDRTFFNKFKRILEETGQHNVVKKMQEIEAELPTVTKDMDTTDNQELSNRSGEVDDGIGDDKDENDNEENEVPSENKHVPDLSDDYELEKRDLQGCLVQLYKQHYSLIPFCPLVQDERIPLDELYVPQTVHIKKKKFGVPVVEEKIVKMEDLMVDGDSPVKRIYLTAHAGMGKTTYCHRLIHDWCEAHTLNQDSGEMDPDQVTMKRFDFLFYIELRHTRKTNVIEMIKESFLSDTVHIDTLARILKHESDKCLIILDGLDEWEPSQDNPSQFSCPGLPHVPPLLKVCVLTTSRDWKLESVQPPTKDLERQVQLEGLSETLSHRLAETIVRYLNKNAGKDKKWGSFFEELTRIKMSHMANTPLLLTMLCCLWHEEGSIGDSLCYIYSSMINLLFDVDECKKRTNTVESMRVIKGNVLPRCFQNQGYFYKYFNMIQCLSSLAFEALFSEKQESSLEISLNKRDLELCFQVGILTESKVPGKLLSRQKKISFVHKTFQEFFAALHVALQDGPNLAFTLDVVRQACFSLDRVHEFSEVFVFLSGMRSEVAVEVSKHIGQLADTDDQILHYRHFVTNIDDGLEKVGLIENLVLRCIRESLRNGFKDKFIIHDVTLVPRSLILVVRLVLEDEMCAMARQKHLYLEFIDAPRVRSMDIVPSNEVIRFSQTLSNLVKIAICASHINEVRPLFDALLPRSTHTLECLIIEDVRFQFMDGMTNLFNAYFGSLTKLRSFQLTRTSATHWQYQYLADFLSRNTALIDIKLEHLECLSSDGATCDYPDDIRVDLTSHDRLRYISVRNDQPKIHGLVTVLPSNGAETCMFEMYKSTPSNYNSFFKSLLCSTNLTIFTFFPLKKINASESTVLLNIVGTWSNLEHCDISNISFENYQLSLSNNKRLKYLHLSDLQMSIECLLVIIDTIPLEQLELDNVELDEDSDVNVFVDHITRKEGILTFECNYFGTCIKSVSILRTEY